MSRRRNWVARIWSNFDDPYFVGEATDIHCLLYSSLCCIVLCLVLVCADKLAELVTSAGFHITENKYILRQTINRKEKLSVERVFVQGKFTKPYLDEQILTEQQILTEEGLA